MLRPSAAGLLFPTAKPDGHPGPECEFQRLSRGLHAFALSMAAEWRESVRRDQLGPDAYQCANRQRRALFCDGNQRPWLDYEFQRRADGGPAVLCPRWLEPGGVVGRRRECK